MTDSGSQITYQFTAGRGNGTEFRFRWRTDRTSPNTSRSTLYEQHRFPNETEWRDGGDVAPVFVHQMLDLEATVLSQQVELDRMREALSEAVTDFSKAAECISRTPASQYNANALCDVYEAQNKIVETLKAVTM